MCQIPHRDYLVPYESSGEGTPCLVVIVGKVPWRKKCLNRSLEDDSNLPGKMEGREDSTSQGRVEVEHSLFKE
jgi:hypothetical protein